MLRNATSLKREALKIVFLTGLLIRQTAFDTFSHRRRLTDVELLTTVWYKAYFQYTHRSSAQIKRRLPPRGGSRWRRVEEYACITKFNIFMPKNSFRQPLRYARVATRACRPLCQLRRRLPILWGATLKREAWLHFTSL